MNIINSLLGVEFGGVTLTFIGIILSILISSLVFEVGIFLVKFAIAADDDNAPSFDIKNIVWDKFYNFTISTKEIPSDKIVCEDGVYYVRDQNDNRYYRDVRDNTRWSDYGKYYREHCSHKTKEEAEKLASKIYGKDANKPTISTSIVHGILPTILVWSAITDIMLLSLSHYFFPTLVVCSIISFFGLTRYISRKVYVNSGKIDKHEERITKLEDGS